MKRLPSDAINQASGLVARPQTTRTMTFPIRLAVLKTILAPYEDELQNPSGCARRHATERSRSLSYAEEGPYFAQHSI